jgi:alpha-methylacyl-CoA racemase
VVDAAMVEGAAHLVSMVHGMLGAGAWRDERAANLLDGGMPFYDVYECADGRFVAVGALEPQFWRELVEGLGVEVTGPQYDPSTFAAQREAFGAAFRGRTRDEWAAVFERTDACVAPVLSLAEAHEHPHALARGSFAPAGAGWVPTTPPRLSETPNRPPGPEPRPGADTRAVLLAHGFTADEVDELVASGAVVEG